MAKKQTIAFRNKQKFIILTLGIFIIEAVASFIFLAQNDFLRYASEGLLAMAIAGFLLPALLFGLAFAFMKKSTVSRRLTQAIVWAFGGMLVQTFATLVWYIFDTNNYGSDLMQLLYISGITTLVLYIVALKIYRIKVTKNNEQLVPGWFEKSFITLGFASIIAIVYMFIRDIYAYGIMPLPYVLYSVIPLILYIILPLIGFVSLKVIKSKISRLFTAMFGLCFSLYVGTGLSQFASIAQQNDRMQDILIIASYIVTTIVYVVLLKRVHMRLKANEKL